MGNSNSSRSCLCVVKFAEKSERNPKKAVMTGEAGYFFRLFPFFSAMDLVGTGWGCWGMAASNHHFFRAEKIIRPGRKIILRCLTFSAGFPAMLRKMTSLAGRATVVAGLGIGEIGGMGSAEETGGWRWKNVRFPVRGRLGFWKMTRWACGKGEFACRGGEPECPARGFGSRRGGPGVGDGKSAAVETNRRVGGGSSTDLEAGRSLGVGKTIGVERRRSLRVHSTAVFLTNRRLLPVKSTAVEAHRSGRAGEAACRRWGRNLTEGGKP